MVKKTEIYSHIRYHIKFDIDSKWTSGLFNAHSCRWNKSCKAEKLHEKDNTSSGKPKPFDNKKLVAIAKVVKEQNV